MMLMNTETRTNHQKDKGISRKVKDINMMINKENDNKYYIIRENHHY
jgi:hypothetical protein